MDDTQKRNLVDDVSPSFCIAKWKQSTIYLQNGTTHSCHHPSVHKIPLDGLEENPDQLHNTPTKIAARREMLQGSRPRECDYCWQIEDKTKNLSDRHTKSNRSWAAPYREEAQDNLRVNPSYLEVSFDSTCNLKCAYCGPANSSSWQQEMKKHGDWPTQFPFNRLDDLKKMDRLPRLNREDNPYTDAFWQWWPTLYPDLHTFRITGGEPLLSKHTWRVLDRIKENPRNDLNFAINTNLSVNDDVIDQFLSHVNDLSPTLQSFTIFTSAEAKGTQAEYIRFGLDYEKFLSNCRRVLSETTATLGFMCAVNVLSTESFTNFLEDILVLRREYGKDRIVIDTPYLRSPEFLDMRILDQDRKERFSNGLRIFAMKNREWLTDYEVNVHLSRLSTLVLAVPDNIRGRRIDFHRYIEEYDRRRGTDFQTTFPDLAGFHEGIGDLYGV